MSSEEKNQNSNEAINKDSDLKEDNFIDLKDMEVNDNSFDLNDTPNQNTEAVFIEEKRNKKSLNKKKLIISLLALAVLLGCIYLGGYFFFKNHYLPNTYISGFNSSFQTVDAVNDKLNQISHVRKVTLIGKDSAISDVKAEDIGLNLIDTTKNQQILDSQEPHLWPLYLFNIRSSDNSEDHPVNEDSLMNTLKGLPIVNGEQVVKTENAKANYNGKKFEVKEEVYGTEVNTDVLKDVVTEALENGKSEVYLDKENCYIQPTLTAENDNLNSNISKLNTALNSVITYDFKTAQEVVDKNTFANWLATDDQGNIVVNDTAVAGYIQALKDKYDTLGKEQAFISSSGVPMTFTNWYSGWEIDEESELAALKDNILSGQQLVKEPVYSSTGRDRAQGNAITGTYLEISIDDQTMWFYKNGQLVVSTPVVTGDVTQGYGTPTGLYEIQAKSTDVTLSGNNADGSRYESPVTFWMPFNGGIGVHDASWRGSYGGSIFRGNGSHGCVNTPYSAASAIYNAIEVSDPVVVY